MKGTTPLELAREVRETTGGLLSIDPDSRLELERDAREGNGRRHLRFAQHRAGLPVQGGRLNLHLRDGRLTSFDSSLVSLYKVRAEARLAAADAVQLLGEQGLVADGDTVREVMLPTGGGAGERAWRMTARSPVGARDGGLYEVFVSAHDGRVLRQSSLIQTVANARPCQSQSDLDCWIQGSGIGHDGKTHPLNLFRGDTFPLPVLLDGYQHPFVGENYPDLFEDSSPTDTFFVDLSAASTLGGLYVIHSDGYLYDVNESFYFDEEDYITYGPDETFEDEGQYGASVSALANVRQSLDYYAERQGRLGVSDLPGQPVDIVSRVDQKGLNAAWASQYNYMFFGSWAGRSLAVALDITGHELTHGVINFSSELGGTDQPGALNEALADMFGVMVQDHATGRLDWQMGEDVPAFPPFRNLEHPERFGMPGHMSDYDPTESDDGGVHTNMSIPCKAFQLAVDGTAPGEEYYGFTVEPVDADRENGVALLGAVLYESLQHRVTPTTGFMDWAVGMLAAADDAGLSDTDADKVYSSLRDAFLATGILTNSDGLPQAVVGGTVLDAGSSDPLSGAAVQLAWDNNVFETTTDAEGGYFFVVDPSSPVAATVSASLPGYFSSAQTITLLNVQTAGSTDMEADLTLPARPPATLHYVAPPPGMQLKSGTSSTVNLELSNSGLSDSELVFQLRPTVDYTWSEVGFTWNDLSRLTDPVDMVGDQSHSDEIGLQTPFPFYFETYTGLYLSTDGYLTLTPDESAVYQERPLPDEAAPRALLAAYWADLDFGQVKRAYVQHDEESGMTFVQFHQVPDYLQDYVYTFQVVLYPDGRIRYYYLQVDGTPESWSRVGVQDVTGREGLEVALNTPDASNGIPRSHYAIELKPSVPPFAGGVTAHQSAGVITGGQSVTVPVTVSAAKLEPGSYSFRLRLETNDPTSPVIQMSVPFTVN